VLHEYSMKGRALLWLILAEPSPAPEATGPPAARRIHPTALARLGALVGAGMVLLAWLVAGVIRRRDLGAWFPAGHWSADLLIGAAAGGLFALAIWSLLDRIAPFRRMERLITGTLVMEALRYRHALIFGLVAGIPEEILFRGAIQPLIGVAATSILFGALHAITPAYFLYAASAGALLGGLAIWRDSLWTPIAAHVAIDLIMFALLIRRWRRAAHAGGTTLSVS
jgi:membrane protease YdiL (CAAX protease family)